MFKGTLIVSHDRGQNLSSHFDPIALCRSLAKPFNSGHLWIKGEAAQWHVSLIQGRLQYAVHSAQTLETLEYHALKLNLDAVVQALHSITQAELQRLSHQPRASRAGWLSHVVDWLFQRHALTENELRQFTAALSEDALEPMLWLTSGTARWELSESTEGIHAQADVMPHLGPVVQSLEQRLQTWQRLRPLIRSPYEQPYCPNIELLKRPVPGGVLSQEILSQLVQLMRNVSIRRLSLVLKQDDIRVAQLLYPYLQYRVLALDPPAPPAHQLPLIPIHRVTPASRIAIPASIASSESASASDPTSASALRDSRQTRASGAGDSQNPEVVQTERKKIHKIVCIDDSPAMLNTIQRYLGTQNFDVVTVENPMESLTALFEMKPNLILMDVSMPGINGNRLCQILRRSDVFKNLPIIMVSGNTGKLDKAKAEAAGATDYLTKPFSREDLLAMIQMHLSEASAFSSS